MDFFFINVVKILSVDSDEGMVFNLQCQFTSLRESQTSENMSSLLNECLGFLAATLGRKEKQLSTENFHSLLHVIRAITKVWLSNSAQVNCRQCKCP